MCIELRKMSKELYAERLKHLMEVAGLDDGALAFRCGWGRTRVTNYKTGFRGIGLDEVNLISEALKPFFGEHAGVYILTGKHVKDLKLVNEEKAFTVTDAAEEFNKLIVDAVDYGRIKLEPKLEISELSGSFVKSCSSYLQNSDDQPNGDQKAG